MKKGREARQDRARNREAIVEAFTAKTALMNFINPLDETVVCGSVRYGEFLVKSIANNSLEVPESLRSPGLLLPAPARGGSGSGGPGIKLFGTARLASAMLLRVNVSSASTYSRLSYCLSLPSWHG